MTAQLLAELPPVLFSGIAGGSFDHRQLDLQPVSGNGRIGIEMHQLYTAEQTGGPAAAIIRYAPGATTAPHQHPGYEMSYVLSGELVTDEGAFTANSLLIMPPDSIHAPRSTEGCLLLVVWEKPVRLA